MLPIRSPKIVISLLINHQSEGSISPLTENPKKNFVMFHNVLENLVIKTQTILNMIEINAISGRINDMNIVTMFAIIKIKPA